MVPGAAAWAVVGVLPQTFQGNKPSKGFCGKLKFENHCFNIFNSLKAHFCSCWWPNPWLCKFSRFYQNLWVQNQSNGRLHEKNRWLQNTLSSLMQMLVWVGFSLKIHSSIYTLLVQESSQNCWVPSSSTDGDSFQTVRYLRTVSNSPGVSGYLLSISCWKVRKTNRNPALNRDG